MQCLYLVFIASLLLPQGLSAYSLDEILALSRKQAKEAHLSYSKKKQIEELSKSYEGAYDTELTFNFMETKDDGELNQYTQGERRFGVNRSMGLSRYFPTGTTLSFDNQWNQQKVFITLPPGIQPDPVTFPRFNPLHEFKYTLTIHQQVWKNLGAKLLLLQSEVEGLAAITPAYEAEIKSQAIQFEAATLYHRLISLNHSLSLVKKLIKESENFLGLVKNRRSFGRSDDVDVASAETELIRREGLELDTQLERDLVFTRLSHLTMKPGDSFQKSFPMTFSRRYDRYNLAKLQAQAKQSRLDVQLIDRLMDGISRERSLIDEKEKPDLSLFASYGQRGLGESFDEARRDLNNGNTEVYGIELVWNLENQAAHHQKAALITKKGSLDLEKQIILDQTARDLELALQKFNGSRRQEQKFARQISSLTKKMAAEEAKYNQARSDKAALSRYQIEIIIAKLEEWEAITASRLQANEISWLIHGYPKLLAP